MELEKLTKDDLKKLQADVDKALKTVETRRKAEARAAIEAVAKEHGFTVEELMQSAPRKTSKSAAKYRNPENPSQTWTGRGRKPNWILAAIDNGVDLSTLEI